MTEADKERLHGIIGENIRIAREKACLKQETLANMLDMSRASIINIEKGRQSPPLYLIWEISNVLKVPIQSFFVQQAPDADASQSRSQVEQVELEEKIAKSLAKHFAPDDESIKNVTTFLISSASQ